MLRALPSESNDRIRAGPAGPREKFSNAALMAIAKSFALVWLMLALIAIFSLSVKSDVLTPVDTVASIEEFEEKVVSILPL